MNNKSGKRKIKKFKTPQTPASAATFKRPVLWQCRLSKRLKPSQLFLLGLLWVHWHLEPNSINGWCRSSFTLEPFVSVLFCELNLDLMTSSKLLTPMVCYFNILKFQNCARVFPLTHTAQPFGNLKTHQGWKRLGENKETTFQLLTLSIPSLQPENRPSSSSKTTLQLRAWARVSETGTQVLQYLKTPPRFW